MAEAKKVKKTASKDQKDAEKEKLAKTTESEKNIVEKEAVLEKTNTSEEDQKMAKAGKRSAKALAEVEQKQAKEERKAESNEAPQKTNKAAKPIRSKLERRGKKYQKAAGLIDKSKTYSLKDALELVCKTSTTKFDSSAELHIRLNVDPKQADQNIRDSVTLPAGTGKTVKVAVFAEEEAANAAVKAGADIAGTEEITKALDKGSINFDVLIAPPNLMSKLAKYARILGPKGLMPNPKSGTVTADVVKGVEQAKAGRIEYRVDSTGIIHVAIGKVSFGSQKLTSNAKVILASIKQNKPASLKGTYVRSISASSSMGPSVKIASSELS